MLSILSRNISIASILFSKKAKLLVTKACALNIFIEDFNFSVKVKLLDTKVFAISVVGSYRLVTVNPSLVAPLVESTEIR